MPTDGSPLAAVFALLPMLSLVLAFLAAAPLGYLLLLTLLSKPKTAPPEAPAKRLVALIPAHNEQDGIGSTVNSLLVAGYPSAQREVVVIADNCNDATAQRAREAGARVLERQHDTARGKGFALEFGFADILKDPTVEGVMVIDADTVVGENIWRAMAARLHDGALAVQCKNRVRNRDATWRTRLLAISLAMINGVRCLGRERLGLSVGLKGNGMAFARATLEAHPPRAFGVVEDVEYATHLGEAGVRVVYAPETFIASESPETASAAVSQRRRWEGGRIELVTTMVPRLLRAAVKQRSMIALDLAIELLIPPLSYPALLLAVGALLESLSIAATDAPTLAWPLWLFAVVGLTTHVLRGWRLSETGTAGLVALAQAPAYMVWKLFVARPFGKATSWVRTTRVSEEQNPKT